MATLAAGDVTTQLRIFIDTNAAGVEVMTKLATAAATATVLPVATTEVDVLVVKLIAR